MVFGLFGKKKSGGKKMAVKKKAFGGYGISFKGRHETVEAVFGTKPLGPHEMTKKIWAFVKKHNLGKKS